MAKKTGKQQAGAANREATKHNKPVPFGPPPTPTDLSLALDPNYEAAADSSESDDDAPPVASASVPGTSNLKRKNPDADLDPARETKKPSRAGATTQWRFDTGKTVIGRAAKMQAGIHTLFKSVPNPRKVALAVRYESEEPDPDIEMSDVPFVQNGAANAAAEESLPEPVLQTLQEPVPNEVNSDSEMPAPPVHEAAIEFTAPTPPATDLEEEFPASVQPPAPVPVPPVVVLPADTETDIKTKHRRLQKLIKKKRAELAKKASILTNANAAGSILDLEALNQFNDKSKDVALKRLKLIQSLRSATRVRVPQIKRRIKACKPNQEASLAIARRCGKGEYYARALREMSVHLLAHGELPEKQQGKGAHHESLLLNPAIHEALQEWVKGTLEVEKGGFVGRMRPAKMRRYVNDFLLPELKIEDKISETTAIRWLKKMGFRLARVQKGVYVDGHERPDVVESRDKLIEYLWLHIFPFCYKYEGENVEEVAPQLKDGEKIHYVLAHDECCVQANDQVSFEWMREGEQPLRNKSRGRIVHISDFILEHCGRLCLTEEEIAAQRLLPKEPLPPASTSGSPATVEPAGAPAPAPVVPQEPGAESNLVPKRLLNLVPVVEAAAAGPRKRKQTAKTKAAGEPEPEPLPGPRKPTAASSNTTPPVVNKDADMHTAADLPSVRRVSTRAPKPRQLKDQGFVPSDDEEDDLEPQSDFEDDSVPLPKPQKKTVKQTKKAPAAKGAAGGKKKPKKAAAVSEVGAQGRTYAENDWVPPPPPAPFAAYQIPSFDARRIIYPGANYDPWWDMPQLIAQVKDAIKIFNVKYPNGVAVFIFDCSSAHEAFSSDALLAHKMNRGPGGKQPMMRDTVDPATGESQSMNFPETYDGVDGEGVSLAGKPKGMEQILRERGLLRVLEAKHGKKVVGICSICKLSQAAREKAMKEAKSKQDEIEGSGIGSLGARGLSETEDVDLARESDCCMQRLLSLQQDFLDEKPLLQLIIEKAGHKCLFLPKFHCELNPIEMVWGQLKRYFRELTDGTFPCAKKLVPEGLNRITTTSIRRYFQHCYRYMDAYRRGLNIRQAAYAVKKYKSHRRIPADVLADVNIVARASAAT